MASLLNDLVEDISSAAQGLKTKLDEQKLQVDESMRTAEAERARKVAVFNKDADAFVREVIAPAIAEIGHRLGDLKVDTKPEALKFKPGVYTMPGIRLYDMSFTHPDPRRGAGSNRKCRILFVKTEMSQTVAMIVDVADHPSENEKLVGTLGQDALTRDKLTELLKIPFEAIRKSLPSADILKAWQQEGAG